MKLRLTVAAVALAAAGCATNFSYIDGNRYFRTEMNTHSVIVLDIDGKSEIRNPVMVEPGVRVVRVQGPGGPGLPLRPGPDHHDRREAVHALLPQGGDAQLDLGGIHRDDRLRGADRGMQGDRRRH